MPGRGEAKILPVDVVVWCSFLATLALMFDEVDLGRLSEP